MLEYGIRQIITNPTLITKTTDIIRLVDSRSHKTRAFVLPVSYESMIEKCSKELEYKKWAKEKKRQLQNSSNDDMRDIMEAGRESIGEYLG